MAPVEGTPDDPAGVVVTDFDVQGMWLTRHVDRYFVALDETRAHLERLGVPPGTITVSGIPIDPVFAEPKDRPRHAREARARAAT